MRLLIVKELRFVTRNAVSPLAPIRRQIDTAPHEIRPSHSMSPAPWGDDRQRHSVARQKTKSPESFRSIRAFGGVPWTTRNSPKFSDGWGRAHHRALRWLRRLTARQRRHDRAANSVQ